ncbi:MAG: holo-ACP synthase [bacterium]
MKSNYINDVLCGVDIIEVERIRKLIQGNPNFTNRIFTDKEINYCMKKKNKWQHFAVRFAAKEAIWKCLGYRGMALRDIGIRNNPDGKPCADLKRKFKGLEKRISISLSHTEHHAVAFAVYSK